MRSDICGIGYIAGYVGVLQSDNRRALSSLAGLRKSNLFNLIGMSGNMVLNWGILIINEEKWVDS